jgi:predicted PurR-regulated permease PerM
MAEPVRDDTPILPTTGAGGPNIPPPPPPPVLPPSEYGAPPLPDETVKPALKAGAVDWRRVHLWEFQPVRDLLVLGAIFGVLWLGYQMRIVTIPVLMAMLLAYLFEPLVRWITRRSRLSRSGAALGIIAAFAIIVVVPLTVGGVFGVVQGAKAVTALATNVAKVQKSIANPGDEALAADVPRGGWRKIRDYLVEERPARVAAPAQSGLLGPPPEDGVLPPQIVGDDPARTNQPRIDEFRVLARRIADWVGEHAGELASWASGQAKNVSGVVGGAVGGAVGAAIGTLTAIAMLAFAAFLTAFFFYFFVTGWGKFLLFWEGLIPERKRGKFIDVIQQMDRVIAGFVRGRVTICVILAVYMTIAYAVIGVPAYLVLGPLIGAMFIAPYIHAIGMPIAMVLLWLNVPSGDAEAAGFRYQWWWIVFAPIGVYVIAQLLDDWVLSPLIQGKTTDLPIPTILFASLAGGALGGIYGLLIAIPIAACIKIIMREVFWPKFRAWVEGKRPDFLPIGRG